jgi:hypothetical protein
MNKSHKTAISRSKVSVPMKFLSENNLLTGDRLDYGCGKGFDAKEFNMDMYDPYYQPEFPSKEYGVITSNYVLNVIESSKERENVLNTIKSLLKPDGVAYLTLRRDIKKDGYTSKGTYQGTISLSLPIVREVKNKYITYKLIK